MLILEEYGLAIVKGEAALYSASENALIISDIHLGFETAMASLGIFPPRRQLRRVIESLVRLKTITGAEKLIINGDLKHVFEKLTRQEREEVSTLIEEAFKMGFKEIIVVRGNHDNYVSPLVKRLGGVWIEDYLELKKGVVVTHGHELHDVKGEAIIIGHEHPAIELSVGGFKDRLPAFLIVPRESTGYIIVLPAMGEYQSGNVVTLDKTRYLSPWIQRYGLVEEALPVISDKDLGTISLPKLSFMISGELMESHI